MGRLTPNQTSAALTRNANKLVTIVAELTALASALNQQGQNLVGSGIVDAAKAAGAGAELLMDIRDSINKALKGKSGGGGVH